MHGEELVLLIGARGRVGRGPGVLVHGERKIVEPDSHRAGLNEALTNVRLAHLRKGAAERAFEVGKLNHLHRRVFAADEVTLRLGNRDGVVELDDLRLRGAGDEVADHADAHHGDADENPHKRLVLGLLHGLLRHEFLSVSWADATGGAGPAPRFVLGGS